jgi:hypothetical protein
MPRGIDAVYLYERLGGWHRMVTLRMTPAGTRSERPFRPGRATARNRACPTGRRPYAADLTKVLNWLSGDASVERAAELQAHHRGDLVEFEGAA